MPTAKKLPSGSWRCLVYSHTEEIKNPDGSIKKKRIYESFTSNIPGPKGKRIAEQAAAEFAANKDQRSRSADMLLGTAMDNYIQSRESILSPRTIMDYKRIRRTSLQSLMNIRLSRITQEDIQIAINLESVNHSPKNCTKQSRTLIGCSKTISP